jgi:hypothetical protein
MHHTHARLRTLFSETPTTYIILYERELFVFVIIAAAVSHAFARIHSLGDDERALPRESAFRFGFVLRVIDPQVDVCVCGLAVAAGNLRSVPGKCGWARGTLMIWRVALIGNSYFPLMAYSSKFNQIRPFDGIFRKTF